MKNKKTEKIIGYALWFIVWLVIWIMIFIKL